MRYTPIDCVTSEVAYEIYGEGKLRLATLNRFDKVLIKGHKDTYTQLDFNNKRLNSFVISSLLRVSGCNLFEDSILTLINIDELIFYRELQDTNTLRFDCRRTLERELTRLNLNYTDVISNTLSEADLFVETLHDEYPELKLKYIELCVQYQSRLDLIKSLSTKPDLRLSLSSDIEVTLELNDTHTSVLEDFIEDVDFRNIYVSSTLKPYMRRSLNTKRVNQIN